MNSQDEQVKEIKSPFKRYIIIAGIMILIVLILYFSKFGFYKLSSNQGDWGTFGDFVGGSLNPLLAFLSLIALLTTIKIQTQELSETRKEIRASSRALQDQSESAKLQIFENTFFKMIDVHNSIVLNLSLKKFNVSKYVDNKFMVKFIDNFIELERNEDSKDRDTIRQLHDICKSYTKLNLFSKEAQYEKFYNYYEDKISNYYGFIYQILKFIKDEEDNNQDFKSKKYVYLFRSLFSKSELTLLAYHCLSKIGRKKFKSLLEHFEFFEHLPIKYLDDNLISKFDKNIFGKSDKWKKYLENKQNKFKDEYATT
ncbi:putative phage abortive infection protein [Arcobacter roscoffensis]|uniref:Phage abortive infection protein n=1 Tax=Arcobacter roscoffensis TaxID=2961520 RepID=A0ABY5E1Y9_9BACT|nr:putative phage abortive infection protein [Arcobacter roscoffensis]UTJ06212.1 putative phage abortive infection protein [Arcobacter roscoffensis]